MPGLARFLAGIADYCCDAWYTFRPSVNEFWDTVAPKYRTLPPPPDVDVTSLELAMLLICRTCGAHTGSSCFTRARKVLTVCHKTRRDDARELTAAGMAS